MTISTKYALGTTAPISGMQVAILQSSTEQVLVSYDLSFAHLGNFGAQPEPMLNDTSLDVSQFLLDCSSMAERLSKMKSYSRRNIDKIEKSIKIHDNLILKKVNILQVLRDSGSIPDKPTIF